jgi:hypothetical protein
VGRATTGEVVAAGRRSVLTDVAIGYAYHVRRQTLLSVVALSADRLLGAPATGVRSFVPLTTRSIPYPPYVPIVSQVDTGGDVHVKRATRIVAGVDHPPRGLRRYIVLPTAPVPSIYRN